MFHEPASGAFSRQSLQTDGLDITDCAGSWPLG
jgi:hypothetical protein